MLARRSLASLLLTCPLILSACADDGDGESSSTSSTTTSSDTETSATADAGDGDGETGTSGDGDGDSAGDGDGGQSYPEPPYGVELGDVLEPYVWQDETGADFLVEDLFNIERRALVLFATAAWCNPCREEAELLTPMFAATPNDIHAVGILFENTTGGNATPDVAAAFNEPGTTFEFIVDPERNSDLIFDNSAAIPRVLIVDSRTMTITHKQVGHDLDALLGAIDSLLEGP